MNNKYHILNGDSLLSVFPSSIKGNKYVLRECLCDGPISDASLKSLYEVRSVFIASLFEKFDASLYYDGSVSEFNKISAVEKNSTACLWFEKDLFCQINFWFAMSLLKERFEDSQIYLVLPLEGHEYSFVTMNEAQLEEAYKNKVQLNIQECELFVDLWHAFLQDNPALMLSLAKKLVAFPFVLQAVQLHMGKESLPSHVRQLIQELGTKNEQELFKVFAHKFPMYGYGDIQFKRLLDSL